MDSAVILISLKKIKKMQKTTINLEDFPEFNRRLLRQISDDPDTGFIRVIVSERNNVMDDVQQIELVAKTYYVNPATMKIVDKMTHRTLSKGKDWFIDNTYDVVLVDSKGQPIPNPKHIPLEEGAEDTREADEREEFLKMKAYDRFAGFLFSESKPVSLPFIWKLNVDLDDGKGYFN